MALRMFGGLTVLAVFGFMSPATYGERLLDHSGNGHHGFLRAGCCNLNTSVPEPTGSAYADNRSLDLDSDTADPDDPRTGGDQQLLDDWVTIATVEDNYPFWDANLSTSDFTVSMHIKPNDLSNRALFGPQQTLFYASDNRAFSSQQIQVSLEAETDGDGDFFTRGFRFLLRDGTLEFDFDTDDMGEVIEIDGEWHHIAATLDRTGVIGPANRVYFYVDGEQVLDADVTGLGDVVADEIRETFNMTLGTQHQGDMFAQIESYDGLMDEFALYLRPLTHAEVMTNATNSLRAEPANGNGPEVLYLFDVNDLGPIASIPGDFDNSGVVDAADIDLLCAELGGANGDFDLNNDGMVNSEDADELILVILGTEYGDADLEGGATLGDLGTLAGNFTSTRTDFGWADGDFNWDGEVTLADLGILAANFGANGPIPQAEFAAATGASVAALVPEPATAGIVALGALALMRRRR